VHSNPLKIGFDGRVLTSPAAGVRRYAHELFKAMAALDTDVEIVAIGSAETATVPPGVSVVRARSFAPTNLGWTTVSLPIATRKAKLDVYHAPAYTAPFFGIRPVVLTIHDCSYTRHPEWYPYHRDFLRRAFYRFSALSAHAVITDSEFSRSEISSAYKLDPDQIVVIPLGVGNPFADSYDWQKRLNNKDLYVLHVGDIHTRRNLMVALQAVIAIRQRRKEFDSLTLRLVGVDRGSGNSLRQAAIDAGHHGALEIMSKIDDFELARLYAEASVFVYPSVYEGFGLPLLEAMACGAPVVAAKAASIPEVLGDTGLLFDPGDVSVLANAIEAIITKPELAIQLGEASKKRAKQFTWSRTAIQTIKVYQRCMEKIHKARVE